jgi:hypothetical protein
LTVAEHAAKAREVDIDTHWAAIERRVAPVEACLFERPPLDGENLPLPSGASYAPTNL